jgi:hypothetical protein
MNASAKILEVGANGAVVQLPERKFPGIVVQGDSLSILVSDFEELKRNIAQKDESEIAASLHMIEHHLKERLDFYESVLTKHGIPLPYLRHDQKG